MKLFCEDKEPMAVDLNMRLNRAYAERCAQENAVFVRVYKHTEGVILGKSQGIDDVWSDYAKAQGVSVSRRDTGGAAVYVNPSDILCYSIFAPTALLSAKGDQTEVYKKFTFELAKQLGTPVIVGGTYYLQTKTAHSEKPLTFGGHSLAIKGKKASEDHQGYVQIDGIVHLQKPNSQRIASLIKLRELCYDGKSKYIAIGGKNYEIKGHALHETDMPSNAIRVRDELSELSALPSLNDVGHNEQSFITALRNTTENLFGKLNEGKLDVEPSPKFDVGVEKLKIAIGHCFVYMGETEDHGVHYEAQSKK